jgi:acyl-CoA thioesterase
MARGPGTAATEVVLDRTWWSWAGAHGGLVASHLLEAMGPTARDAIPRALHVHFLRAVDDRPLSLAGIEVTAGRSTATWSAVASQGGRPAATATGVLGPLGQGPIVRGRRGPHVAPPTQCPPLPLPLELVPFAQHVEIRPATAARPLAGGSTAELTAWLRFVDDRPVDAAGATVLLDALPPALFATFTQPVPIPTVELAAHFSGRLTTGARPGWVLARIRTEQAEDGWAVDDAALFDPTGELLATGRQTRLVLASPAPVG